MYRVIWNATYGRFLLSVDCMPLSLQEADVADNLRAYEYSSVVDALEAVDAFEADPGQDWGITGQDTIEVVEWQSSGYGAVVRRFSIRVITIVRLTKEVL